MSFGALGALGALGAPVTGLSVIRLASTTITSGLQRLFLVQISAMACFNAPI
jgi:hypothetical protein